MLFDAQSVEVRLCEIREVRCLKLPASDAETHTLLFKHHCNSLCLRAFVANLPFQSFFEEKTVHLTTHTVRT